MAVTPRVDVQRLRTAIQDEYAEVATTPDKGFHFHTGRALAAMLGYDASETDALPDSVIESFAGVGNPFYFGGLQPGETVVEVGSGAGFDAVLAAYQVGPRGLVIGVDMTPAMLDKARANAALLTLSNLEFRHGYAEDLPIPDGTADVVISNGVINLSPEKSAVFQEVARVLKPGGRVQIADIIVTKAVPDAAKENIDLWTGWIAGALLEAELAAIIEAAGLAEVHFCQQRWDTFSGASSASSAAAFGTQGVVFRATKPQYAAAVALRHIS